MHAKLTEQELTSLKLRIASSPEGEKAELQAQLETLVRSIKKTKSVQVDYDAEQDADVEAMFDNMPV